MPPDDLPETAFGSADAWREWLDAHHGDSPGLWLRLAKKGSGIASVTRAEAVDAALCYGWIDGQARSVDDHHWLQKFTPRRARSPWSRINREKALGLIASGEMRPAGMREVERAQADGRWDAAYEPPSTAAVPDDLAAALAADPAAGEAFAALDSRNRYAILYRLQSAKRPDTRERRVTQFVEMLHEGRRLYP